MGVRGSICLDVLKFPHVCFYEFLGRLKVDLNSQSSTTLADEIKTHTLFGRGWRKGRCAREETEEGLLRYFDCVFKSRLMIAFPMCSTVFSSGFGTPLRRGRRIKGLRPTPRPQHMITRKFEHVHFRFVVFDKYILQVHIAAKETKQ